MNLTVGIRNFAFSYDKDGFRVRSSLKDEEIQIIVPVKLRELMLRLSHYAKLAGHPGSRKFYDIMRRSFYCPHMSNDVYSSVNSFPSCLEHCGHPDN